MADLRVWLFVRRLGSRMGPRRRFGCLATRGSHPLAMGHWHLDHPGLPLSRFYLDRRRLASNAKRIARDLHSAQGQVGHLLRPFAAKGCQAGHGRTGNGKTGPPYNTNLKPPRL